MQSATLTDTELTPSECITLSHQLFFDGHIFQRNFDEQDFTAIVK